MNKEKIVKSIPNMFTLANLTCGMVALLVAVFYKSQTSITIASCLIFLGMAFDFCDGLTARKLNAQSPIGKELDSFADAITFGIAPVAIYLTLHYNVQGGYLNIYEIFIATFYAMCAVYRLARYNTTENKGYFEGIPTTLSGGLMAIFILVCNYTMDLWGSSTILGSIGYIVVIALALGMVSKFRVNRIGKTKTSTPESNETVEVK